MEQKSPDAASSLDDISIIPSMPGVVIPVSAPPPGDGLSVAACNALAAFNRARLRDLLFDHVSQSADLISAAATALLIELSGGVIRDFLFMLRMSALEAIVSDCSQIDANHIRMVANELRQQYVHCLTPLPGLDRAVTTLHDALGRPDDWPTRDHGEGWEFDVLRERKCILKYVAEGKYGEWYDLHPLVKEHVRRRNEYRLSHRSGAKVDQDLPF